MIYQLGNPRDLYGPLQPRDLEHEFGGDVAAGWKAMPLLHTLVQFPAPPPLKVPLVDFICDD